MELVASIVGVFVFAALILWGIEGVAKLIGSRNTWITLAGVIPFIVGLVVAISNRETLLWWQLITYPLIGPLLVFVVLILGMLAVNPLAIIELVCLSASTLWGKLWSKHPSK